MKRTFNQVDEGENGYILGIDPQPALFGIQCRDLKTGEKKAWFNIYLKKKSRFENSQKWQEYIYEEAKKMISVVVPKACKTDDLPTFLVIEQQKGRVCSCIEMAVVCVCKELGIDFWVANPMCWKRKTGVECTKSHYGNKKAVEKLVKPDLDKYMAENYTKEEIQVVKKAKRIHDLCDADKITEAGLLYLKEKSTEIQPARKRQKTKETSCDEKHLSLYYETQQQNQCPKS